MMPTTSLYHWNVAGSGVDVLIDVALIDQLRVAGSSSTVEIGGILYGYFDNNYTVITSFEPVESEHRRGEAYILTKRDQSRFGARLETRRRNRAEVPVGFFRSHLRPGLFLDEGDNQVISSFFPDARQVALLVRPSPDGTAVGGFFFWEDGEINRKQTYLPFPMSSRELEAGKFPILESAAASNGQASTPSNGNGSAPSNGNAAGHDQEQSHTTEPSFHNAETLEAPRPASATTLQQPLPDPFRRSTLEKKLTSPADPDRRRSWQLVGVVAAAAAFCGYLIGTSGTNRDRFGSRPGDITLNSAETEPPAPAPPKPLAVTPLPATPPSTSPQTNAPTNAASSNTASSNSANTGSASPLASATTPSLVSPTLPSTTPKPPTSTPSTQPVGSATAPLKVIPTPAPATPPAQPPIPQRVKPNNPSPSLTATSPRESTPVPPSDRWQHFHPAQPTSASDVASAEAPPPLPEAQRPIARPAPAALSSVSLESVESGSVSRAISKIPLFGSLHHSKSGSNFTPPQAVKSFAPNVPPDLARELTGTLPVDLRLKVDSSGHVSSVEILSHQTAPEFVRLAGDAAYNWQFEPARVKDKAVTSDVIAHFKFRPAL